MMFDSLQSGGVAMLIRSFGFDPEVLEAKAAEAFTFARNFALHVDKEIQGFHADFERIEKRQADLEKAVARLDEQCEESADRFVGQMYNLNETLSAFQTQHALLQVTLSKIESEAAGIQAAGENMVNAAHQIAEESTV